MQADFIQLINLTLQVEQEILLNRVNCNIKRADFVAIIGDNGVGKSSFLRLLAGLCTHKLGQLKFYGTYNIGYAPDVPPLYPYDSVGTYLSFIGQLKNVPAERIAQCLKDLDLHEIANKKIVTLSKGTQQRLNLAQAVISNPGLLILDEPTNGLDTTHCQILAQYLKNLQQQNTTIIFSSHQYSDLLVHCNYMLKIQDKTLTKILLPATTTTTEVINDPHHHTT